MYQYFIIDSDLDEYPSTEMEAFSKTFEKQSDDVKNAFGSSERQRRLAISLMEICRRNRKSNRIRQTRHTCTDIDSPVFLSFLAVIRKLYQHKDNDDSTTALSWKSHCDSTSKFHPSPSPACQAAAFSFLPFSLSKEKDKLKKRSAKSKQHKLNLFAVTVDSRYKTSDSLLLNSACNVRVPITIIKEKPCISCKHNMFDYSKKFSILKKYLESLDPVSPESTVILFTDAHDVIIQSNEHDILQRFYESQSRILFSGEEVCYPFMFFPENLNLGRWLGTCPFCANGRYICDDLYPDPPPGVRVHNNKCLYNSY